MSYTQMIITSAIASSLIFGILIFRGYKIYKDSFNEAFDETFQKARRTTGLSMMSVGIIAAIIFCCIYSLALSQ